MTRSNDPGYPLQPGPQNPHRDLSNAFRTPGARRAMAQQDFGPEPEEQRAYPTAGAADRGKPSSVRLPKQSHDKLAAMRAETGMTNGQIFIVAIEATHDRLVQLLYPGGRIGGGVFAARGIKEKTSRDEEGTQVTYRMSTGDFAALDGLIRELGATSRSHLISAALSGYFDERHDKAGE